jgi:Lon protease-like protein
MSTHTVSAAQADRAIQALHNATWFALCEGDRYTAMGRKAVANSFYNLLPMLAEIRRAIVETPAAQDEVETRLRLVAVAVAAAETTADDEGAAPAND